MLLGKAFKTVKNIDAASKKVTLTESDVAWKRVQNVKNIDAASRKLTLQTVMLLGKAFKTSRILTQRQEY